MRIAVTLAVMMILSACTGGPHPSSTRDARGATIAHLATQLVGTPYQFGGADRQGFDCSGLAVYAHEGVGLAIPRTAADQKRAAHPVSRGDLELGDLLFFRMSAHRVDHVGIYAGRGRFVHAPRRGEVVSYASLDDPYYRKRFAGAGRFWSRSKADAVSPH